MRVRMMYRNPPRERNQEHGIGFRSCSIISLQRSAKLRSVGFQGGDVILTVAFIKEDGIIRNHSDDASRRTTQGFPASIILRLGLFERWSPCDIDVFIVVDVVVFIMRILLMSLQVVPLRLHLQGRGITIV